MASSGLLNQKLIWNCSKYTTFVGLNGVISMKLKRSITDFLLTWLLKSLIFFLLTAEKWVDRAFVALYCSLHQDIHVRCKKWQFVYFPITIFFSLAILFCSVVLSVTFVYELKLVFVLSFSYTSSLLGSLPFCRLTRYFFFLFLIRFFVRWLVCSSSLDPFKSNLHM